MESSTRSPPSIATTVVLACGVLAVAVGGVLIASHDQRFGRFGAPLDVDPQAPVALSIAAAEPELGARDRSLLGSIASAPTSVWITGPARTTTQKTADAVAGATKRGAVATLVAYNIPGRDCGSHSASAERLDADAYRSWIGDLVAGLGDARSIVIIEPDALAQLDCLDESGQADRLHLLRYAVNAVTAQGSWAYLDAGHSGWVTAATMASRLDRAGVADAAGFSLNVSNFRPTAEETAYGLAISQKLPSSAHFVIDTGRNGAGTDADGQWCNPPGRALGTRPTTATGERLVDAYLWIKTPGYSDGPCNGGPQAGQWWTDQALSLAANAVVN